MNRLERPIAEAIADVAPSWRPVVDAWRESPAGRALLRHVAERQQAGAVIYPARVLHALELTPLHEVRVVILGQDPYHGAGQAEGLAFSVPPGCTPPPSLRNILREIERDLGLAPRPHGHLGAWARQGVLLLNTCLTVEDGAPASHAKKGWEALTDSVVEAVAADPAPKVFMLWGTHAQGKRGLVLRHDGRHLVLESNHPSPLSARRPPAPFVGCGHFGAANRFLVNRGFPPIRWGAT